MLIYFIHQLLTFMFDVDKLHKLNRVHKKKEINNKINKEKQNRETKSDDLSYCFEHKYR